MTIRLFRLAEAKGKKRNQTFLANFSFKKKSLQEKFHHKK